MYLLDANVFIQAKNLHYGFDFCPAFWDWLDQARGASTVTSITAVGDELSAGRDDLATWAEARPDFFRSPDSTDVASLQAVSAWASGAGYDLAAINTFLQLADFYLVAHPARFRPKGLPVSCRTPGSARGRPRLLAPGGPA